MAIEFEAFALSGHHFPIWAMDIMTALVSRGIMCAMQDLSDSPPVGVTPLIEKISCLINLKALYRSKSQHLVILCQLFLGSKESQGTTKGTQ